tara:strand:+ start:57 stop:188 length:132 start_codon:yes stop_codon:yes gene_type:complete
MKALLFDFRFIGKAGGSAPLLWLEGVILLPAFDSANRTPFEST